MQRQPAPPRRGSDGERASPEPCGSPGNDEAPRAADRSPRPAPTEDTGWHTSARQCWSQSAHSPTSQQTQPKPHPLRTGSQRRRSPIRRRTRPNPPTPQMSRAAVSITARSRSSRHCGSAGQQTAAAVDPRDDKAIDHCLCGPRRQSPDRTPHAAELAKAAANKLADVRTER